jgi:hypothetical protein
MGLIDRLRGRDGGLNFGDERDGDRLTLRGTTKTETEICWEDRCTVHGPNRRLRLTVTRGNRGGTGLLLEASTDSDSDPWVSVLTAAPGSIRINDQPL